jgi:ribosomal protein L11 methyltransferase
VSNSGWRLTGELAPKAAEHFELSVEQFADNAGIFPPTVSRFEQPGEDLWRVDVYFIDRPEPDFLSALLDHAGLANWQYNVEPIEDRDWVTESQKLLSPVRAGRFLVFGSHDADKADAGLINLQIDAGQAFGTGKHETTAACLNLLDQLADAIEPESVLDIGTGSAVLALAAAKVWPAARVTATDIDPIAIEVSIENCAVNKVSTRKITSKDAAIALVVADGLDDPNLIAEQPYSIVFANILAGPLISMAPSISTSVMPGGHLILSGLLETQKQDVLEAYQQRGMSFETEYLNGEWAALQLRKN